MPSVAPAKSLQESGPPLYYLKDKEGNLQPVPGFRFEDFEQMFREKLNRGAMPRYSLQALKIEGTVKAALAEAKVTFRILVRDEDWVRVPLRLDQAILRGPAQYKGPGQHLLHFENEGGGYVAWIRGAAGQEHQLTLDLLVPLSTIGDETTLKLHAPRATESELKLTVPTAGAVGEVSEGATLLTPSTSGETGTLLTALGIAGDFELHWRRAAGRPALAHAALEADGTMAAKVDVHGIAFDAKLVVRSFGGPFESFRVRLPQGAQLSPKSTVAYSVLPVAASGPTGESWKIVEVRLPRPTSGPVEVQLASTLSYESGTPAGWCDLAGYEVVDAVRQSGHIAITADRQWRVLLRPNRGVRQIDELPEPLPSEGLVAAFEYFVQPYSLAVRVVPRDTHVSVDPEYLFLVGAGRVSMQARLRYAVRTAKVRTLDMELPQWQLDEVGPENLVAVDAVAVDSSGLLSIPLKQESMGQIEITVRAHRKVASDTKSLTLEMPHLRADSQSPAAVVMLPDDDVELTPGPDVPGALVRQQTAPQMKLPQRQQDPLYYRAEPGKAVFTAGFRIHERSLGVRITSEVQIDEERAHVQQKFAYTVAYRPVDRLALDVPQSLAASGQLKFLMDGKPLAAVEPAEYEEGRDSTRPVRRLVILPGPRIGPCEMVVDYAFELDHLFPADGNPASIPLVMPAEGELAGNRAIVTSKEGIRAQRQDGPWTVDASAARDLQRGGLQLVAAGRTNKVDLGIHLEDPGVLGSTVVDRAWVQTWLTSDARQDRAVFRLTSSRKMVELIMPADVDLGNVELWLDGKRTLAQGTPEGRLAITLPGDPSFARHELEVLYHSEAERAEFGLTSFELPRLAHDTWVHRTYWQLVLPRSEHVVKPPAEFAPEFVWGWNGMFWGRQPVMEQFQLETWAGARHFTELPSQTNRYLFSTLGAVTRCRIRTADRALIVLAASGLALVGGLLVIYVRACRHPAALLVAAIALAAAAILLPDAALLGTQAAGLGLLAAMAAALLRRSGVRRTRGVLRDPSSSVFERGSSPASPRAAGNASTQIASPAVPVSIPDSHA
ncbi:MAG: hypothetical protein ACLQNE_01100 [Thermoguttaceae bacterium]